MTVSDVIHVGDKVDIRLVQQIESKGKDTEVPEIYKSKILDMKDNGNLEISMPTEKGEIILLPLGVRFEFIFYCQNGSLYRSIGQIVERYKKDGFYMLEIQLRTGLEKRQRREFYRYNCMMDFLFYILDDEKQKLETADEVWKSMVESDVEMTASQGTAVDLSGGGMRFRSSQELKAGDKILVMLHLLNDKMNRQFKILGNIVGCVKVQASAKVLYESRVEFKIENARIREEIIRYIFEEERKIRKKENG